MPPPKLRPRLRPGPQSKPTKPNTDGLVFPLPDPDTCRARARYVLNALREKSRPMDENQQRGLVLKELRRVNPFVVEEVFILSCKDAGLTVEHPKYTHDGGIDGAFTCPRGDRFLVQMKRYKGDIKPEDVSKFSTVVAQHQRTGAAAGGFFCHTGTTNLEARYYIERSNGLLQMLSGDSLIHFLLFPERLRPLLFS